MIEIVPISPLIVIGLYLLAGCCIFLFALNRLLIQIRDGRLKRVLILLAFLITIPGSVLLGNAARGSSWAFASAIVLAGVLAGEARRLTIRWRTRGEPPVQGDRALSLARPFTTTDLAIIRYEIGCPGWSGRTLRIAHLSDMHVNNYLPCDYFHDVIQRVNETEPDLILITGDFVTRAEFTPLLPPLLAQLMAHLGTFAVLGNHDYWASASPIAAAVKASGVTLLRNRCTRVRMDDGAEVLLCGYEEPWGAKHRKRWQPPAMGAGQLNLILTHTPDNIYALAHTGATAVFAGHYHAGQFRVPLLGSLVVPSSYGRRFDYGHFRLDGTHLFVTAGVGASAPPFRIYCRPDVLIVDIRGDRWE